MQKCQLYLWNQGLPCWSVTGLDVKVSSPLNRDPSGHVDADGDSAVSDGGPDSVGGVGGVSSPSEAEEIEVPVAVGVSVRPSVAAQRAGFGQFDHQQGVLVQGVCDACSSGGDFFASL